MSNSVCRNSSYGCNVKVYFSWQCQISALQCHGSKILDRTINHFRWTDLYSKFQLSKRYSGWKIGDRRTDERHNDFSRELFYFPHRSEWGCMKRKIVWSKVKHSCYFSAKTSLKFVSTKNKVRVLFCPVFHKAPFTPIRNILGKVLV
jgi:hypothetical protein